MAAPKEIEDLVARFEQNIESYKSGHYNETQLRREFVDPFFETLGWDVNNEQGFAEAYKDVIHEESIRVGATTKAPDYSFRIGGQRKFFLETKKPSVDIKGDIHPAFQLRRYAWTAKLPLSILTDFEELSVYDCRIKPDKADKSSQARVMYISFREYLTRWDEIAGIFSKEAVLKGSFDKFAEDKKSKRGTAEVDAAFLEEIAGWREILARNIALRNSDLNTRDLNYAVQAIVNRIVFLRICEDRGIERHMHLQDLLNGERVYPRLCELFHRADERYNSGLFHFEKEAGREDPDTLTLDLSLDDKPLKEIIRRLYYPESPYEFSVFPAEILGQVYEQFLGKVIRLTEGHRAVVEDKPEVKKAGGVKYTPVYIVDYIVKTTLGPMLEGKTPQQVVPIHVLDPACGSGSFLIVAYQYLLDWHRDWYAQKLAPLLQNGQKVTSPEIRRLLPIAQNEKGKKGRKREIELPIYQGRGGEWRLTTTERKRILLNNIYGVDIDSQAVEVTKLSLLLKVLEGENEETIDKQLKLFQERALPDLENNIKCGNSLIGTDIMQTDAWREIPKIEQDRINPFDWDDEFQEIMQTGGFHAIIGNPPYIRIQIMKESVPLEVEHYKQKYESASKGNYDIYVVFVEKALSLLNRSGRLGFILPHKFFNVKYGQPLRNILAEGRYLSEIVHFGDQQVFSGATTYTCLLFLNKAGSKSFSFQKVKDLVRWKGSGDATKGCISAEGVTAAEWNFSTGETANLFNKLNKMPIKLEQIAHLFVGLQTSADSVYIMKFVKEEDNCCVLKSHALNDEEVIIESELLHPLLKGAEISRYEKPNYKYMVLFPYLVKNNKANAIPENELKSKYPAAYLYLNRNKGSLLKRSKTDNNNWWLYPYPKNLSLYNTPKLLCQVLSSRGNFTLDGDGKYYFLGGGTAGGYAIKVKDDDQTQLKYLLGILNSKLTTYYVSKVASGFRGGFFAFGKSSLRSLPLPALSHHDGIVEQVDLMLSLHKQLQEARTPHEKTALQRQIEATDKQIDQLVYDLYELTEDERNIIDKT